MQTERRHRRFTRTDPCPICGGHESMNRGQAVRCFGYYDRSGNYARCTRDERAGQLSRNADGTYSHRLHGKCRCGQSHSQAAPIAGKARPAATAALKGKAEQRFRSYYTLAAYLRKRYGEGTAIRHWTYRDAAGNEVFRVLRIDYKAPDGSKAKSYRPCHQDGGGRWRLARPPQVLPVYNLPEILAAPPKAIIIVVEGEKCVDLAASIGLSCATTSAHGARAFWLSDWSPLAGRTVAILGDTDEDGAGYAAQVSALLAVLDPPASVRIVSLPGLAEGEDIEQFIAARRSAGLGDDDILAQLHTLIKAAG